MTIPKIAAVIKKDDCIIERLPIYRFSLRFIEHSGKCKICFIEKEVENDATYGVFEPIEDDTDEIKAINLETDFCDFIEIGKKLIIQGYFDNNIFSEFLNNRIFYDMSFKKKIDDIFSIPILQETKNNFLEFKHFIDEYDFNNISFNDFVLFLSRYNTKINVSYLPYIMDEGYKKTMFNDEKIIDNSKIMIVYDCYSVLDILFSFLHYYKAKNYKLKKCNHCERWFFKTSSSQDSATKYCKRKSPVLNYNHLNCEQAVRNIRQQCTRIKNRIETKADNANKEPMLTHSYSEFVINFKKDCDKYKDADNFFSAENLSTYMEFLQTTEKERKWLKNGNNK